MMKHVNSALKKTKSSAAAKDAKVPGTSQFDKQLLVSPEMCAFAGWEVGSHKSRVEVTKAIWDYVKVHELRTEENKRQCILDDVLKTLLNVDEKTLSYPRIQKHIGQHLKKIE